MGEPIRIMDIAKRIIRLAGYTPDRDVKIKIVGPRPGEKVHEELFQENEARIESNVPGVLLAKAAPMPLDVLLKGFEDLKNPVRTGNHLEIKQILNRLMPNYRSEVMSLVVNNEPGPSPQEVLQTQVDKRRDRTVAERAIKETDHTAPKIILRNSRSEKSASQAGEAPQSATRSAPNSD